ncbi:MAG: potassium-transporting ATPase subunit F [Pirellulales bacterium]
MPDCAGRLTVIGDLHSALPMREVIMLLFAAVVVVGLTIYLTIALIRPELFL